MDSGFRLFPEQGSAEAARVDALYYFLLSVSGFFTALVCVLILFFVVRYRRGAKVNRHNLGTNVTLEIVWTIIPLVLTMVMFGWGAQVYFDMRTPPEDCMEIHVVGKQWMWKIQHPDGRREINQLHVPVGRPVRLQMISEDVIHSFYLPAMRTKMDVLPGKYTTMWFRPTKPGRYHLFCAEYCGTSHSQMTGELVVLEPDDYAQWLRNAPDDVPLESLGRELFQQFRCHTCHAVDQQTSRCPPLEGIYNSEVTLADGSTVIADEAYLRESILRPAAKVVAGYKGVMPTYQGQIGEQGVLQIIEYLKTLEGASPASNQE
ncbi:MAG: cytochrome c oxidase subunit II [Pirellulales bacterium]